MTTENEHYVCNPAEHKTRHDFPCGKSSTSSKQNLTPPESRENVDDLSRNDVVYMIPRDHGWAWVICAGCFVITYIMSLYDQVLAIMFSDIVSKFDVSVPTAALVFTIYSLTFSAGSVISTNIIVPRIGDRKVIVIAAIINSTSSIIIAFSPNIAFYLTFHLFKGLSIGSMWIPALGLLGHYFKSRRSLASTITNSGIGVSLLTTPLLLRKLLDNFGFRGSLLIISGIEMQAIAIGMLLRPPSAYTRNVRNTSLDSKHSHKIATHIELYSLLVSTEKQCDVSTTTTIDEQQQLNSNISTVGVQSKDDSIQQNIEQLCKSSKYCQTRLNLQTVDRERTDNYEENVDEAKYKSATPISINQLKNDISLIQSSSQETQYCEKTNRESSNTSNVKLLHNKAKTNTPNNEQPEKSSLVFIRRVFIQKPRSFCGMFCDALSKIFDFSLLKDCLVRIMLVSTAFGALIMYIPTYIPTLAEKKGVTKTNAAMLLTICGGVNLVSSVMQGLFIDCRFITAAKFIVICQCIVGTMCHLTYFFTSFPTLLFLSVTHGMFGGARMSLMPVVAMDFVGVTNLSKTLGFNAMVATLSLSIHHPFLGHILEKTGSFSIPYHYVGFALYLSAGLLLLEKFGRNLNAKRR